MGLVDSGMKLLIKWGLASVILPFILMFVVVYALLQSIKLFGKDGAKYNALLSFCLAFFTIYNYSLIDNLPMFFSRIAILFILIVCLMIISGLLGIQKSYNNKIVITVMFLYILYTIKDIWFNDITLSINKTLIFTGVTIIIFSILVGFIVHSGSDDGTRESSAKGSSKKIKDDRKTKSKPSEVDQVPNAQESAQNILKDLEKSFFEEKHPELIEDDGSFKESELTPEINQEFMDYINNELEKKGLRLQNERI